MLPRGYLVTVRLLTVFRAAFVALASSMAIVPILGTPYGGDDLINHNTWPNLGGLGHSLSFGWQATGEWITNQGRFFPGSFALMATVWTEVTNRPAYKLLLVVLALAVLSAVAAVAWRLTRSIDLSLIAAAAVTPAFQLRYWFDGWSQFHGLIPLTVLLMLGCFLLADRYVERGGRQWLLLSLGAWALGAVTYEIVLLALPALLLLLSLRGWRDSRFIRVALGLGGIALGLFLVAIFLRLGKTPVPKYELAFTSNAPATAWRQFIGALPVSQYWSGGAPEGNLFSEVIPIAVVFLAVPLTWALVVRETLPRVGLRRPLQVAGAGLSLAVLPALLLGLNKEWQASLPPGQAYLSVGFQSVGLALLVLGLVWAVGCEWKGGRTWAARIAVASVLALAVACTVAANAQFVSGQIPGEQTVKPVRDCKQLPYQC